jgi:hypothetical protein
MLSAQDIQSRHGFRIFSRMLIKKHVLIAARAELVWDVITDLGQAKQRAHGLEDYRYISAEWTRFECGRLLQIANKAHSASEWSNGVEHIPF